MKPLLPIAALVACAAAASPAVAMPPPLRVAVTPVASTDGGDALAAQGQALRGRLIETGWFAETPSTLDRATLEACAREAAVSACIKPLTIASRGKGAPEVVVLLRPTVGGKVEMTCFGPGDTTRSVERQEIVVDLNRALDADAAVGMTDRSAAAGCIVSAAAESGW